MQHVVFEGFADKRLDGCEEFFIMLMKPVVHYHGGGSLYIDGVIDDVLIDMASGFPPKDESATWDMKRVNRAFDLAKSAYHEHRRSRYAYFRVVADVISPDDPVEDPVYVITEFDAPAFLCKGACYQQFLDWKEKQR